jgi:hypothetical protein
VTEGLDELGPMTPIALPLLGIHSHDPRVDVIPHSLEKISILSFVLNRNIFQEFACGWGNLKLNICKNFSSDTLNVSPEACCLLKIREAVSAIL